ncbi:hypothetical protein O181_013717 [Austropuccinia psidii MF-1]|uniref:Uncharacterized protein n=1 Tax=Austropuccinia psidii MF-1 TaxID=1389203 RepID=A0A9Q3C085_9BASI|nr:hypothetical protein [Austropuccinia psidii MF-1]
MSFSSPCHAYLSSKRNTFLKALVLFTYAYFFLPEHGRAASLVGRHNGLQVRRSLADGAEKLENLDLASKFDTLSISARVLPSKTLDEEGSDFKSPSNKEALQEYLNSQPRYYLSPPQPSSPRNLDTSEHQAGTLSIGARVVRSKPLDENDGKGSDFKSPSNKEALQEYLNSQPRYYLSPPQPSSPRNPDTSE